MYNVFMLHTKKQIIMYWSSTIASVLADEPWEGGMTKEELIDYAERNNAPSSFLEDIMELDDDEKFYGLEDILSDIPTTDENFGWHKDE